MFDTNDDSDRGIDLLTDPIEFDGELTDHTREGPNGRFVEAEPADTDYGVDRRQGGQFASRDRGPVPQLRFDDGQLGPDAFAVGNFGRFDGGEGRFKTAKRRDR